MFKRILYLTTFGLGFTFSTICSADETKTIVIQIAEGGSAWDKTKEVASDTWKGTKNVTSDVWDGTKNVASDVWEGTKNVASDVKDGMSGNSDKKTNVDEHENYHDNIDSE